MNEIAVKLGYKSQEEEEESKVIVKTLSEVTVRTFEGYSLFNQMGGKINVNEKRYNHLMPGGNGGNTYLNKPAAFRCRFISVYVTF